MAIGNTALYALYSASHGNDGKAVFKDNIV